MAIGLISAALALSACSGSDADDAVVTNTATPSAPGVSGQDKPATTAAAATGIADGAYSCNKISGSMLVNMGEFRVRGGQVDTSVLESVGATFKGVEPSAEGFRLSYTSKSGWAEVMDCEPS